MKEQIYGGSRAIDFDFANQGNLDVGLLLTRSCDAPESVPFESRMLFKFNRFGLYLGIPGRDGKWSTERCCFEDPCYQHQWEICREKLKPSESKLLEQIDEACVVTMIETDKTYRISILSLSEFASGQKLMIRDLKAKAMREVILNKIFLAIGTEGNFCVMKYNNETFALQCCLIKPIICRKGLDEWPWSEQGEFMDHVPGLARGVTASAVSGGVASLVTCGAAGAGFFVSTTPGILWGTYTTVMSVGAVMSFAVVPITVGAIAVGSAAAYLTKCSLQTSKGGSVESIGIVSHAEILEATNNLAERNIIGRGGLGPVYSGRWRDKEVAVKILKPEASSSQGIPELTREIDVLRQFRHVHLVPLLAYCISEGGAFSCLVYPLMRTSLSDCLLHFKDARMNADDLCQALLLARTRVRISADIAAALEYLHCGAGLLHRDVKTSNILLDDQSRARISDVGLARPIEQAQGAAVSRACGVGTFGYIDPEYEDTNEFRPSSDVFSFGVVLLELLTGLPAVDKGARPPKLHKRVGRGLLEQADAVADGAVSWNCEGDVNAAVELARIAAECIDEVGDDRPTARELHERLAALAKRCGRPRAARPSASGGGACQVCMSAPRRVRFRPCHHVLLCEGCVAQVLERGRGCPCCEAAVEACDVGDFPSTYSPDELEDTVPGPAGVHSGGVP